MDECFWNEYDEVIGFKNSSKVLKKKALDDVYLKFEDKLKEKNISFIEYMQSDEGRDWDITGRIIKAVYCPGWKEWKLGSDEKINLIEILRDLGKDNPFLYEDLNEFCSDLLYAVINSCPDKPVNVRQEIEKQKEEYFKEMTRRFIRPDISNYGDTYYTGFNKIIEECLSVSLEDTRWELIKPVLQYMNLLGFEDVYDFSIEEAGKTVEKIFSTFYSIEESVNKIKEEIKKNGNDFKGIRDSDLNKLSIYDFDVKDCELEIMKNKRVYDVIESVMSKSRDKEREL